MVASGEALLPTVVVLEGVLFCFVCVVVVGFDVVVAGVSEVFFFTHDGWAGAAAGSPAAFTHGGRKVVLFVLSLAPRFTFVIGILITVSRRLGQRVGDLWTTITHSMLRCSGCSLEWLEREIDRGFKGLRDDYDSQQKCFNVPLCVSHENTPGSVWEKTKRRLSGILTQFRDISVTVVVTRDRNKLVRYDAPRC